MNIGFLLQVHILSSSKILCYSRHFIQRPDLKNLISIEHISGFILFLADFNFNGFTDEVI